MTQILLEGSDIARVIDDNLPKLREALIARVFFKEDLNGKNTQELLRLFQNYPNLAEQEVSLFISDLFSDLSAVLKNRLRALES